MATRDPARTANLAAMIGARVRALGASAAELSRQAGLHGDAIRNIERGSVPNFDTLVALARTLDLPAGDLMAAMDRDAGAIGRGVAVARLSRKATGDRMTVDGNTPGASDHAAAPLPLFGYRARAPGEGADVQIATVTRPRELADRTEAYAAYVDDDANAPVIRAGHIAYIDPSRPAAVGHLVRLIVRGVGPVIGVLAAQTGDEVEITVTASPQHRRFPRADIGKLERVIGFNLLEA